MPALGRPRRRARPGSAAALAAAGNGLSSSSLSSRRLRRSSAVEMRRERERRRRAREQQPWTPPPPATDGPISDLMQRQYKEDADATHGTLVGDDADEARRLFLADVVERLDAATSIASNQPWAAQFIGTMGELACGIGTIKVESVWHRVPTNMASSRIPPSPLVLADGGAAAPMLHTVCLQVKRLEARIHEVGSANDLG
uniref:Kinase-like protein n=1 Tax=Oryza sativa subsp. japonica TaxID=39947 RepID=Q6H4R0_ORYSJ|nr:kinase-like protein [Oryza sativa Japonica Group]BAD26289.1 kinase-like protein [Oryza sativa Japonica Group]